MNQRNNNSNNNMSLINKKRILFGGFLSVIMIVVMASCGNDTSSANTKEQTSSADTSAMAPDSSTAKTVVKKRKGKASLTMGAMNTEMKAEKDKDGVYNKAEKMPQYPGGEAALSKFVEDNINYPQNAIDDNTEGTVNVSFIVDEKGNVMDPVATGKSAGRELDQEAVKVIKQMPAWKPGLVKGKPVKTRLSLPVTFKLENA